jgi:hypothetical protein
MTDRSLEMKRFLLPVVLAAAACGPERLKLNEAPLRPSGPITIVGADLYVVDDETKLVKLSTSAAGPATVVATFPQPLEGFALGDTLVVATSRQKSVFRVPLAGGEVTTYGPYTDVWGVAALADRTFGLVHTGTAASFVTGALVEFLPGRRESELSSALKEPVALRRDGAGLAWLNRGTQRKSAGGVVLGHEGSKVVAQAPERGEPGALLESAGEIFAFALDAGEVAWTDAAGLHRALRGGAETKDFALPAREDASVVQLLLADGSVWVRRSAPGGKDDLLRVDAAGNVLTVFEGADITGDVAILEGAAYVGTGADVWRLRP